MHTGAPKEAYDALLNQYEEGMDSATIDRIFGELKEELVPFVQQILKAKQPDDSKFQGGFDVDAQEKVQKMKKGIIFDMDGTLWDSGVSIAEAWNIVIERRGLNKANFTADDIHGIMGKTIDGIADALFEEYSKEERMDITRECLVYENEYLAEHGGELYEKLEDVLIELSKNYPLYIVSNCEKGYIEGFLKYYGFGKYFKDFESHGNTGLSKGQNIRLVAERNGLTDVVYVGDIQSDYNASKEAGVGFIHAAYGFGTIQEEVLTVSYMKEIPMAVEKYFEMIQ